MRATRARTLAQSFGFALLRNGGWNSGTVLIKRAHAKAEGFRVHAYSAAATASFPFFSSAPTLHRGDSTAIALVFSSRRLVWCNVCLVISLNHTIPKEIFVLYFDRKNRMFRSYIWDLTKESHIFQKVSYQKSQAFLSLLLFIHDCILLINDE